VSLQKFVYDKLSGMLSYKFSWNANERLSNLLVIWIATNVTEKLIPFRRTFSLAVLY